MQTSSVAHACMENKTQWSQLPVEMVSILAGKMDCPVDTSNMARVNNEWRSIAASWPKKKHVPFLVLPPAVTDNPAAATLCCIPAGHQHPVPLPNQLHHARLFGSHPGGWLFANENRSNTHFMYNPITSMIIRLPSAMAWHGGPPGRIIMPATTLSDYEPSLDGSCICAAIASPMDPPFFTIETFLVFWRLGGLLATCKIVDDLVDVIFCQDSFHCLARCGNLWVCSESPDTHGVGDEVHMRTEMLQAATTFSQGPQGFTVAMYLVQSRDEMLMLHRLSNQTQGFTSAFRIYRLIELVYGDDATSIYAWSEMTDLDGQPAVPQLATRAAHFHACMKVFTFLMTKV